MFAEVLWKRWWPRGFAFPLLRTPSPLLIVKGAPRSVCFLQCLSDESVGWRWVKSGPLGPRIANSGHPWSVPATVRGTSHAVTSPSPYSPRGGWMRRPGDAEGCPASSGGDPVHQQRGSSRARRWRIQRDFFTYRTQLGMSLDFSGGRTPHIPRAVACSISYVLPAVDCRQISPLSASAHDLTFCTGPGVWPGSPGRSQWGQRSVAFWNLGPLLNRKSPLAELSSLWL
ncbi:uncharacterized protein LOC122237157 isoform X1 [Panthera tigris]|uniref:uncharacterized protein LOC122237157 isoform X1 n=1 Tax=Panthera tigris TaxID=9694 RepID=UPI001C6FA7E8|nr:uncharacterized protein LOC122237157 isoform X1 [Panthera tigris]